MSNVNDPCNPIPPPETGVDDLRPQDVPLEDINAAHENPFIEGLETPDPLQAFPEREIFPLPNIENMPIPGSIEAIEAEDLAVAEDMIAETRKRKALLEARSGRGLPGFRDYLEDVRFGTERPAPYWYSGFRSTWIVDSEQLEGYDSFVSEPGMISATNPGESASSRFGWKGVQFSSVYEPSMVLAGAPRIAPGATTNYFRFGIPLHIPSPYDHASRDIRDTLRHVSDKTWFNSYHLGGPNGYVGEDVLDGFNRASAYAPDPNSPISMTYGGYIPEIVHDNRAKMHSSAFYFSNTGIHRNLVPVIDTIAESHISGEVNNIWGVFNEKYTSFFAHADASDPYTEGNVILRPRHWRNYTLLLSHLMYQGEDPLGLGFKAELQKLLLRNHHHWNWKEYFFGVVPEHRMRPDNVDWVPEGFENTNWLASARAASARPEQTCWYKNIQNPWGGDMVFNAEMTEAPPENRIGTHEKGPQNYNRNIHPVMPYYGKIEFDYETPRWWDVYAAAAADPIKDEKLTLPTTGWNIFADHVTNVPDLISKEEADELDLPNKTYYKISPVYSYYDCLYERIMVPCLPENKLPDPYQVDSTTIALPTFATNNWGSPGGFGGSPTDTGVATGHQDEMAARVTEARHGEAGRFLTSGELNHGRGGLYSGGRVADMQEAATSVTSVASAGEAEMLTLMEGGMDSAGRLSSGERVLGEMVAATTVTATAEATEVELLELANGNTSARLSSGTRVESGMTAATVGRVTADVGTESVIEITPGGNIIIVNTNNSGRGTLSEGFGRLSSGDTGRGTLSEGFDRLSSGDTGRGTLSEDFDRLSSGDTGLGPLSEDFGRLGTGIRVNTNVSGRGSVSTGTGITVNTNVSGRGSVSTGTGITVNTNVENGNTRVAIPCDRARELANHMRNYYGFLRNPSTSVYINEYSDSELEDIYSRRNLYPMFVEIELGNLEKSAFSEALMYGDNPLIMKNLVETLKYGEIEDERTVLLEDLRERYASDDNINGARVVTPPRVDIGTGTVGEPELPPPAMYPAWKGYEKILYRYVNQTFKTGVEDVVADEDLRYELRTSDTFAMKDPVLDLESWWQKFFSKIVEDPASSPLDQLAVLVMMASVQSQISRLIKRHDRDFASIMSGVPAFSEVIGYRIDKFHIDPDTGESTYLKCYFVSNHNEKMMRKFIDPQVKYGEVYEYAINRIVVIGGNRYGYLDPHTPEGYRDFYVKAGNAAELDGSSQPTKAPWSRLYYGVIKKPSVKVMVLPSTTKRVSVVDSPPVFPNVNFIPFKNNSRRLQIHLQSNGGDYSAPPVILDDSDRHQFEVAYINQNMNRREQRERVRLQSLMESYRSNWNSSTDSRMPSINTVESGIELTSAGEAALAVAHHSTPAGLSLARMADGTGTDRPTGEDIANFAAESGLVVSANMASLSTGERMLTPNMNSSVENRYPIHFRTDDPTTTFEVFRTDVYPESYESFRGKKIYKIFGTADNATIIDDLVPNKKYYYTFRAEDVHGHVSNPTNVYEVMLNKHNEAAYLDIKIVKPKNILLEKMRLESNKIPLRQFLRLKPSLNQRRANLPADGKFSTFRGPEVKQFGPPMASNVPSIWDQKFKLRIRSKQTGKEIDIDFKFKVHIIMDFENNGDISDC